MSCWPSSGADKPDQSAEQKKEGQSPEQIGIGLYRGFQKDKVAIFFTHEINYLFIAVTGFESFAYKLAHVLGKRGVALINGLVLADDAAQRLSNFPGAVFQGGVGRQ